MAWRGQEKNLLPTSWVTLGKYITSPGVIFLPLKRKRRLPLSPPPVSVPTRKENGSSDSGRRASGHACIAGASLCPQWGPASCSDPVGGPSPAQHRRSASGWPLANRDKLHSPHRLDLLPAVQVNVLVSILIPVFSTDSELRQGNGM